MDIDPELLNKILKLLKTMIPSREDLINWIKEFIDDIKTQEIAVNSVKTTSATVGVLSTIALFTPFAPLGVAGLVGSGVAGVATAIGDVVANKIKEGNLDGKVEEMKQDDSNLSELMKKLEEGACQIQKELNISKEDAYIFYLVGVPKVVAQVGTQVINGAVEMVSVLPHLKAARDAMTLGASLTQAFELSGTVFQGARVSALGAGQAARLGTTLAVTTTAKVLGAFGAVIGVADVIYSWVNKNPNRASAEKLLPDLEKNLEALKKMEKELSEMKKI